MANSANIEIERRFLPDYPDFDLNVYPRVEITQGYISFEPAIRLRGMGDEHYLTVKTRGTIIRGEYEIPLSKGQFDFLWLKTEPGTISKTRYKIPLDAGLTAELDIYYGDLQGLITVEVEFPTVKEAQSFIPPWWFGKEVTDDHRYANNNLAKYGKP
ncbi:MAG: CYTH domain-containing protein [Defluviitaleaceae bacterium]|nr:CYTH domain-containing protein [Defluviitaleaceae bacterium]MCL2836368.1 CYTH domain-containing protein [Defluviitaleaceae bacterium]